MGTRALSLASTVSYVWQTENISNFLLLKCNDGHFKYGYFVSSPKQNTLPIFWKAISLKTLDI